MAILTFKNQEGETIKVNSPDGSMPNEKELDQLFEQSRKTPKDTASATDVYGPMALGTELVKGRIGSEAKNTLQRTIQGILGFAEGATGGVPRGVVEGNPLDASLAGLVGSSGSGREKSGVEVPRGSVSGQILGNILVPGNIAKTASEAIKGTNLASILARGATAGGIEGLSVPTEKAFNPKQRLTNAVLGAGVGAAANSAIEGTAKLLKGIKSINESKNKLKALEDEAFKLRDPNSQNATRLKEIMAQKELVKSEMSSQLENMKVISQKSLDSIEAEIANESKNVATSIKPKLSKAMRDFKASWGERWDNALTNSNSSTRASDVINSIDETVNDLVARNAPIEGNTMNSLNKLRDKMTALMKESASGLSVEDPIIQNVDLVNELRAVKSSFSKGANSGASRVDDLAGVTFYKNMTDKLKGSIKGMDELYSEYSKFKDMSDYAYKTFKPQNEKINSAMNVLKNLGKSEDDLVGIKKVQDFLGEDFTKNIKTFKGKLELEQTVNAENISKVKTQLENRLNMLSKEASSVRSADRASKYAVSEKIRDVKNTLDSLSGIKTAKDFIKFTAARGIEGAIIYNLLKLSKLGR